MLPIAEAFLERTWDDDAEAARIARDQRAAQLQAAGYECACANLWNVAGYRVYVLSTEPAEAKRTSSASSSHAQRRRLADPDRSIREVTADNAANTATNRHPARRRVVTEVR